MQFKHLMSVVLAASLSFILAACSGNAGSSDATNSTDIALSQSVSVGNRGGGTLTIRYPEGWTSSTNEDSGMITLTASDNPEKTIGVSFLPPVMVEAMLGDAEASAAGILNAMTERMLASAPEGATIGEVVESTVAGKPAASLSASAEGNSLHFLVLEHSESGVVFVFGSAPEETSDFVATLETIAASANYEIGAETEETTAEPENGE